MIFAFGSPSCRVRVRRALLEPVVFLDCLVVEIAPVDDEQNLVHPIHLRSEDRGLERGKRLAAASRVPDIPAAARRPLPAVVLRDEKTGDNALGCGDLVWTHRQQRLVRVKDAVARQDVQEDVLREEGLGKVDEVDDRAVLGVGPPTRKLERVGGELSSHEACAASGRAIEFNQMPQPRRVRVVLGVGAVRDDEELHVVEEPRAAPERVAPVAAYLVERLAYRDAAPLELDVDERQPVDQNRDIVAAVAAHAATN